MKKLYTIAACLMAGMSLQAQTYLTEKDFQDQMITSGGWTNYVVTSTPGTYTWETSDLGSSGNFYARASGYNGTPGQCDDTELWMITPAVNLTTATNPVLNFRNAEHFDGEDLELLVSTNYDGTSDPSSNGNWVDITSSATWDTDPSFFVWTSSGDVDLSAYNGNATVYIAFKYTSNSSSPVGCKTWEIDEVTVTEPIPPTVQTIFNIQNAAGDSPYKDSVVTTYGIVTAFNANGYAIQDGTGAFTGIWVEDAANAGSVNRGDSLEVTGLVKENFNFTILDNVSSMTVVSQGNAEPMATPVTTSNANMEDWEGTKIVVENAPCTLDNDGFGQWVLNDGSGNILIDDEIYDYPTPITNNIYWVTGIGWYAFSEFKIQARDANDVLDVTGVNDQIDLGLSTYPNPVADVLNVNSTYNIESIIIYSIEGKLMDQLVGGNTQIRLNTSDYAKGIYVVKVRTSEGTGAVQFVK